MRLRLLQICVSVTLVTLSVLAAPAPQADTPAKPPSTTPSVAGAEASPMPRIESFRLMGERWTCTLDGKPLSGLMLKPDGPGPFPAIVLSHGLGGSAQALMTARGRELCNWGFMCIATDYTHARSPGTAGPTGARGGVTGVDFSTAGARPENIRRALVCLEILRQQKEVDPRRIAAYGHSMGAFVTIALTAAASHKVAAAVITSGGVATGDYRAGSAPAAEVAARVRTPFLILQGALDRTVPPESSDAFKHLLDKAGVPNARYVFDAVGHNVPTEAASEVNRVLKEWFIKRGVLPAAEPQGGGK